MPYICGMNTTPFHEIHLSLGAKMAPFAGYEMPISYSGIKSEHEAVRHHAGIFDVSHMGEFILKGAEALNLIQQVTSNDASSLENGEAQYSCLPNKEGGIVDDLLVYCIDKNNVYMLVVNASNIEKDWKWISDHNTNNVEMHNISGHTALLAVQGPKAMSIIQKLTELDIVNLKYYTFVKGSFCGEKNILISATGYTGSGGVEIYFDSREVDAQKIWKAIMEAGAEYNIEPCGLGCRDTLRLEMGFCLFGNDIDDTTSPIEAGLSWITKFSKAFNSSEIFEAQKKDGIKKKLVGFELIDRGIPRKGYTIHNAEGEQIGEVTSGTQSPSLSKAIGMGYVKKEASKRGSELYISVRGKMLKAVIKKMPFYVEA